MAKAKAKAIVRPNVLAEEIGVDAKSLRAFLRSEFPRTAEDRNTSWELTAAQVKAVREHFTPTKSEKPKAKAKASTKKAA